MQATRFAQRMAVLGLLVAMAAGGVMLHRFWRAQLSQLTGGARWIWVTDALETVHPAAGLFVGNIHLDAQPPSALLKICGDREYVVYVNGSAAGCGWSRPGFRLDMYDVAHLLRQGDNVVAVEVRSPTPVGGLLLSLDVVGIGQNVLVSGPDFVLRRDFSLGRHDPSDRPVPVTWGMPPRFPWGYPVPRSQPRTLVETVVDEPTVVPGSAAQALPGGGWRFALPEPILGYLWLVVPGSGAAYVETRPTLVSGVDLARIRDVAQPVVLIDGQTRWMDPVPRTIGAVYVFGADRPAAIEVWPVSPDFSSSAPGVVQGTRGPVQRTRWTTRTPPG